MAKFNSTLKSSADTLNCEEATAYTLTPKTRLVSKILSWFVEDTFYKNKSSLLTELEQEITELNDPIFIAKLALYARIKCNMRSTSHLLAGLLASMQFSNPEWDFVKSSFFENIIQRLDDMTEILSVYKSRQVEKKIKLPNALKNGFKRAFNKFDNYQIAKYQMRDKSIKLIDVVNLVHPIPQESNRSSLSNLVKNTLLVQDTWESTLSNTLQGVLSEEEKVNKKKEVWETFIKERKLGYMALLRNLRNILNTVSNESLDEAIKQLEDSNSVMKSKVLPYRFYSAYKQIESLGNPQGSKVLEGIGNAADIAVQNTPQLGGQTLVVLDCSSSMTGSPSSKSEMNMIELGALFAASFFKRNSDSHLMIFSDDAKYLNLNRKDTLLSLVSQIMQNTIPSGTSFEAIFDTASQPYNRIIILSDMQGMDGSYHVEKSLKAYRKRTKSDPTIFNIDMSCYGTIQFPENKIIYLSGWSEKILDLVQRIEKDPNALLNEIQSMHLG